MEEPSMATESFSFTLRQAVTHADLLRACAVRAEAYGRKSPEYREPMLSPDEVDASPWTAVYLCEDKVTGDAVGTMRIQTTAYGGALEIEKYAEVPADLKKHGRGEISRLSAVPGADPFVRLAMWKAGYLHCLASNIRWLILGVRKPGLLKAYEQMGAKDVTESVALPYAGNLIYRVLGLDVLAAESDWQNRNHPLLQFMVGTTHPDIYMPSMHRPRHVVDRPDVSVL
jgi:hypothetical protein